MLRKAFCFVLAMILLSSLSVPAQTIDEVITKYLEARGGMEKLKSIHSMKMTGTVFVQGLELPFTAWQKRPNFQRSESIVQGQTIVQGYDGEVAWMINPLTGSTEPQKLPEDQAKRIKESADFDGLLVDYKEKGYQAELMGKEDMEGTEVYKIKLILDNGDLRYGYLDAEYYLELKWTAKIKQGEAELDVESYLGDYKEVNGLMLPHSIESRVGGNVASQVKITTIEMNVEIDDTVFKMPAKSEETAKE